jgi:hypothetical protein
MEVKSKVKDGLSSAHCEMKYSIGSELQAIEKFNLLRTASLSKIQIARNFKPQRNSILALSKSHSKVQIKLETPSHSPELLATDQFQRESKIKSRNEK